MIFISLDIISNENVAHSLVEDMDVWTHRVAQQLMNPLPREDTQWNDLNVQEMSELVDKTWNSMLFTFNIQKQESKTNPEEESHFSDNIVADSANPSETHHVPTMEEDELTSRHMRFDQE